MLERILDLMIKLKINKNQLAKMCNLPRTTIYNALQNEENCKKTTLETMRPIAEVLNTTLDYLITGRMEEEPQNTLINDNTVVYVGADGKRNVYEVKPEDAAVIDAMLDKFAVKKEKK